MSSRAGQVVVIRRPEKSVAIRQDFQHTFREDVSFFFTLSLQDFEDEVLLTQAAGARKVEGARNLG